MRTIKFRGKRIDNGEWVYGSFVSKFKRKNNVFVNNLILTEDGEHAFEVDPETVCELTGLTDKSGKEIYEGDIVIGANGLTGGPSEVLYKYSVWQPFSYLSNYNGEQFEVIGNIHDNPELLKQA